MMTFGAVRKIVLPLLAFGLGLVAWQLAGQQNPVLFATPGQSAGALVEFAADGSLGEALWQSAQLYVIGLSAAIFVGVVYGFLLSRVRLMREGTEWLIYFVQAIPVVALTPFILSGLGFGLAAKSLVVFIVTVFPILINTSEGARQVPSVLAEVAKIYGSNERRFWIDVLIPHSMPYVMTGVRQGIAIAFVGTVAAEFFLNPTGLGGMLLLAGNRFDSAAALGLTLLIAVLAAVLVALGGVVEKKFSPWRQETAK
ncbi:ABC transporter permease [Rhizomonospora bruguierae]|uniref:ABC transporter permease n=1 Tax=Rhizomonospora bruguierae TaxID=1581705 RepID=UPI001BCABD2D|nr:ABC transporter permease subunit [Micromonospora sp. NBRC 107566]